MLNGSKDPSAKYTEKLGTIDCQYCKWSIMENIDHAFSGNLEVFDKVIIDFVMIES